VPLLRRCKMTRMIRIRYAIAAVLLVGTLWGQTAASPASNSGAPATPPEATPPPDSKLLEIIKKVKPEYPPAAAPEKLQGQVIVRIVVDQDGDVESTEVISGNPVLANAAVDAVKQWKFKPFIRNGQPVKAAIKLPFDFAPPVTESADASASTGVSSAPEKEDTTAPAAPKRVSLPLKVTQGRVIHRVEPIYPTQARIMQESGTVLLGAIISKEGTIKDLRVISRGPLFNEAAIDAVKQWRYRPYLLNGEPVEVETTVEVNFWVSRH
jgi:TonB family protein